MLKRPSSRRKSKSEGVNLNLVPILDTMVTLIGFLLFTISFITFVHIESPFPVASSKENEEKLKEKPLQLTVTLRDEEIEIWSPFNLVASRKIPHAAPGQPDVNALHLALLDVKKQFAKENKVVLVPTRTTNYDVLVAVMDAIRMVNPTDPPVYIKNEQTGIDEPLKMLFPEIIFGNLLGDA